MPIHPSPSWRYTVAGAAVAIAMLTAGCQSSDTAEPAPPSDSNTAQPTPDETTEALKDCAAPANPPEAGEVTVSWVGGSSAKGKVQAEVGLTNSSDLNAYNIHVDVTIELHGEDVTDRFGDQLTKATSPILSELRHGGTIQVSPVLDQPDDWPSEVVVPPDLVITAEVTEVEQWCAPMVDDDPLDP